MIVQSFLRANQTKFGCAELKSLESCFCRLVFREVVILRKT